MKCSIGNVLFRAVAIFLLGVIVYGMSILEIISTGYGFLFLNILIFIYLLVEIKNLKKNEPAIWFFNPVVLSSMISFGAFYLLSNVIFIFSDDTMSLIKITPDITMAMVKFMFIALIAVLSMWIGYYSSCADFLLYFPFFSKLKKSNHNIVFYPRKNVLVTLVVVSLFSKLIQIKLGTYGYLSTINSQNASQNYDSAQLVYYISQCGSIALLIVSLMYFSEDRDKYNSISVWFYFILFEEVFMGFLSGFKSAMFIPFLVVLICQYVKTQKIDKKWFIYTGVFLIVAFSLIPIYRGALQISQKSGSTGVNDIYEAAIISQGIDSTTQNIPILIAVLSRLNLSYVGSQGISYYDNNDQYLDDPNFLMKMITSPLDAWVPRFIWSGKSISNDGVWYTRNVLRKYNSNSSTAMGLIVNLYMSASIIAVVLGYFFLGVMQRLIFQITNPNKSLAGAFVYIAMLSTMSVNSEMLMYAVLINFFRLFPLLLIFQHLLFKSELRS